MSRIQEIRNEILGFSQEWVLTERERELLLDEYEALVELRALENILGIKVGPVE